MGQRGSVFTQEFSALVGRAARLWLGPGALGPVGQSPAHRRLGRRGQRSGGATVAGAHRLLLLAADEEASEADSSVGRSHLPPPRLRVFKW